MPLENIQAHATLRVRHERPYDYDDTRGLWLYKRMDADEEYRNIITNRGRIALHSFIYGTAAQRTTADLGSGMHYIGLSNNSTTPAATDTTLASELATNGLSRTLGTVSLPTGTGTITQIQNQFMYSGGGTQGVQKAALFDHVTAGNMAHEIVFAQRTLATSDTLTLIFSITLS